MERKNENSLNGSGHMAKIATALIYGKTKTLKIVFVRTRSRIIFKHGMKHPGLKV